MACDELERQIGLLANAVCLLTDMATVIESLRHGLPGSVEAQDLWHSLNAIYGLITILVALMMPMGNLQLQRIGMI